MNTGQTEQEIGIVTAVQGDEAWVEIIPQTACENCAARILCVPDPSGKRVLKVYNSVQAGIGQRVTFSEKSNLLLYISFLQYGLPFLGFIAGVLISYFFHITVPFIPVEISLFIMGIIGLGLSALLGHYRMTRLAEQGCTFFAISGII